MYSTARERLSELGKLYRKALDRKDLKTAAFIMGEIHKEVVGPGTQATAVAGIHLTLGREGKADDPPGDPPASAPAAPDPTP